MLAVPPPFHSRESDPGQYRGGEWKGYAGISHPGQAEALATSDDYPKIIGRIPTGERLIFSSRRRSGFALPRFTRKFHVSNSTRFDGQLNLLQAIKRLATAPFPHEIKPAFRS